MKAITLWQPWASLIAVGAKVYETRSWAPPERLLGQRIAIHAAKKPVSQCVRDSLDEAVMEIRDALWRSHLVLERLPLGVVVCTAVLADARQVKAAPRTPGGWMMLSRSGTPAEPARSDYFGDYSEGRWVWRLADIRRPRGPILVTGRQGWFDVELPAEVSR